MSENKNFNSISSSLMVSFCNKNSSIITPELDKKHCKLDGDGKLYLDLDNPKDRQIIDILMTSNEVAFDGKERKIINRCYQLDGTALFITVEDLTKTSGI